MYQEKTRKRLKYGVIHLKLEDKHQWFRKGILKSSDFWIAMVNLAIWVAVLFMGLMGVSDMYMQFIGLSSLIIGMNLMDKVKKDFEVKEDGL